MSFVAKLAKSGSVPIHYITCKDKIGRDCFYFVMSSYEKMKMLTGIQEGVFNVNDYGKVIESGFGKKPSQNVRERLKAKFNFDFDALN